jgi:hypothetical protein
MKVVINRCYGGFGLSLKAVEKLKGCGHIRKMKRSEYFKMDVYVNDKQKQADHLRICNILADKTHVYTDEHRNSERDCPKLVKVVEEMGKEASGPHGELEVVEIPADVKYTIEEYDGIEHIAEAHRTWG